MMANIPADGWDRDERDALAGLESEIDALQARHAKDPDLDLLRAADAGLLPDDVQARATTYLAGHRWSQALLEGVNDAEVSLDQKDATRLLGRIRREAGVSRSTRLSWVWPALAAAAAGVIAIVWVMRPSAPLPERQVAVNAPPPAAVYALALDKPEVKLSAAALTWRGAGRQGDLTTDLKPGLDAFRRADYATARRELTLLTSKYPSSVEPFFYLGVSQLFTGDPSSALDSLTKGSPLADATFAADIAWYRAIAEERVGRIDRARADLQALCTGQSPRAAAACAALPALK